ncbi:DUF6049 family protein [Saccharomonospora saliphila]|uniref:DUF6049 family protein n=1 Tax=Saccharomonospora saliphila TaxID=369829 RepID=UPI00037DCE99|nr:DUF6049 family protein [Saccharomonospora saliphila]
MSRAGAAALVLFLLATQMLAPGPSAGAQPSELLRMRIDGMSPRVATSGDETLTLSATVTNTGDRPISDLVARVQSGPRQTGTPELGRTLTDPPSAEVGASDWVGAGDRLDTGESATFSIDVDLARLGVSDPGAYPLLLNVNGTPAYGGAARLAAAHLLLPVLGENGGTQGAQNGTGPAAVSTLWPITARTPKIVAAPHDGPVVLSDDDLARELAPGGRLHALVSTAESRRADAEVFASLCFAVDPDLLETVNAMSTGYRVRTPDGAVAGRGQQAAREWLDALRELVAGHCVVQLPYAGADLAELDRVDSGVNLVGEAVSNGAAVLDLLRLEPKQGTVWTRGGLTDSALRSASESGTTTVLADPARVEEGLGAPGGAGGGSEGEPSGGGVRVVGTDPLVTAAFTSGEPSGPSMGTAEGAVDIGTQNALGALAVRAGVGAEPAGGPVLVAPVRGWNASEDDLTALLDTLTRLSAAGALVPAPLDDALAAEGDAAEQSGGSASQWRTEPAQAPVPGSVVETLSEVETTAADLRGAMSVDPTRQVEPVSLIQPLHNAVARAVSTAWRTTDARRSAASAAEAQLQALRDQVTVRTPSQPVSLASESSPLPITLSNSLPVTITVRVDLGNSAGLRPAEIGDTPLAADSRVSRLIPADTLRSGRFIVRVAVTTPDGTTLGTPSRMELVSSELGSVAVVLTATAGAALLLLSGLRIYRRVKAREGQRG